MRTRVIGKSARGVGLAGKYGDPGRNRTDNIQLRRLALYPIELRGPSLILPCSFAGIDGAVLTGLAVS
jgi:hypothetical protein